MLGLDAKVYQLPVPYRTGPDRARRDLGNVLLSSSTNRVCVYVVALPYTPGLTCSPPSCADCCGTLIGCSVRAVKTLPSSGKPKNNSWSKCNATQKLEPRLVDLYPQ
jgi:hypothetical protein